jgi:hypothetical protein
MTGLFILRYPTELYCPLLLDTPFNIFILPDTPTDCNKCATHTDCNSIQVAIIPLLKENCYHGTRRFINVAVKHCTSTIIWPNKIKFMSGKLNPASPWSVSIRFSEENCAFVSCVSNLLAYRSVTGLLVLIILWEQLPSVTFGVLKVMTMNVTVFSDVPPCSLV